MSQITLNIPQEVLFDLRATESSFSRYAKSFIAMDLYRNKNIALGYCAQLAEMPKDDFVRFLGANDISIFEFNNEEEFLEEADNALRYSEYKPADSSK